MLELSYVKEKNMGVKYKIFVAVTHHFKGISIAYRYTHVCTFFKSYWYKGK